jgi:hypothetical protein
MSQRKINWIAVGIYGALVVFLARCLWGVV